MTTFSRPFQFTFTVSLLVVFTALTHANSGSTTVDKAQGQTIEQAQSALNEAKNALEAAQSSLNAAREKKQDNAALKTQSLSQPKNNTKLYKWVDDNGSISYQDSPPPKDVRVLDSDVLKDLPKGQQTVKELRRAGEPEPVLDGSQPVMVYTADNCKPCQSVVLFLTQKQVPFIERDIRNDRKARQRLSNLSKQISVPSLFIGKRIIQGHSKPMITRALQEAGYLKP